ncbi:Hypothetical protein, putative [Bodo saltans]|uniref:Uncharacterized protein n=1 Tax=Bodo saltans TaxID=75058 RepID=A0A0S4IQ26_BODSA|nr:Hypothetical protein, putative [Bodo saltans]|eukprot:CUE79201.1 Hypothetical protein, putative [Bodo saltans]
MLRVGHTLPTTTSLVGSVAALCSTMRCVSTARFDHPPYADRQKHTYRTLPIHDANYFGGRLANLREIGPVDGKKRGRLFKRNPEIAQFNVDVWCAQQTLRKRWKQRDWEVVELPFSLAPAAMQRVIPEVYTDVPQMVDPSSSSTDRSNIRSKVYALEDVQEAVFLGKQVTDSKNNSQLQRQVDGLPYKRLLRVDKNALTLEKFL